MVDANSQTAYDRRVGFRSCRAFLHASSVLAAIAIFGFAGCAPPAEVTWSAREGILLAQTVDGKTKLELKKPTDKQRNQATKVLSDHFGTPAYPKLPAAKKEGEPSPAEKLDARKLSEKLRFGGQVYQKNCAACHGATGDGNGPAAAHLIPRPRDYRLGIFKFTSTPRGERPRREDLQRVVRRGAKGTSMPSFRWMPLEELEAVVEYVILLSQRGQVEYKLQEACVNDLGPEDEIPAEFIDTTVDEVRVAWETAANKLVLPATVMPPMTPETIEKGRQAFKTHECVKCHGLDGKGRKLPDVVDSWGNDVYAADFTSRMLHGGRRPIDIYRRIFNGVEGGGMPQIILKGDEDPDTIWHMVHFVLSFVEGKPLAAPAEPSTTPMATTE